MKVDWKVRAWSRERGFFDRYLRVDTASLAPLDRHVLEYILDERRPNDQAILKLRHLFQEASGPPSEADAIGGMHLFCVPDYFEALDGSRVSLTKIMQEMTGDPHVVAFSSSFRDHDVELSLDNNSPIPPNPHLHINLSQEEIDCLAYFVRDGQEIRHSKFRHSSGPILEFAGTNAVLKDYSDELVRSFVAPFRRLYMSKEPGNFCKACDVYSRHFLNKRITKWVAAEKAEYEKYLASQVHAFAKNYSFSVKRLLDSFIYTRYAHQPSKDRVKHFTECLAAVGNEPELIWLFCAELRQISYIYTNTLQFVENELAWYLEATKSKPSMECRPLIDGKNLSDKCLEDAKKLERLHDHATRLGTELWDLSGTPASDLPEHIKAAQRLLKESLLNLGIRFE